MKYIHTFWSKPLFENKFNEFNISLDTILLDYAFSVDCIHKIDHKIVLFADEMGAELLSFIPYDEVHIVENMNDFSVNFAAQLKFYALEHSDLGDAIIDGDLFIRHSAAHNIIVNSNADIVYSFFEPNDYTVKTENDVQRYTRMYEVMSKFSYEKPYYVPSDLSMYEWMNTSLIRINNQELKDEYIRQYYHHKNMLESSEFHYTCWPDIIIEQFFLTQLCENNEYTSKPVIDNFWIDEGANDYALDIGFTHLGYGKHAYSDWVKEMFKSSNYNLYELYVEQYNKYKK